MKTFVIGDVHGSYNQFQNMLDTIQPDLTRDRLIMLGDYIDRGPHSYAVIKRLIALETTYGKDHVVLLRGNHEQMAINNYPHSWCDSKPTTDDFRRNGDSLANYLPFLQSLRLYFEDDHFIYVHGGIRHGIPMADQHEKDLLWIREEFYLHPAPAGKTVIFGHTPTIYLNNSWRPFFAPGHIGIDTGCVYGGRLSALQIANGTVVATDQIKAIAA